MAREVPAFDLKRQVRALENELLEALREALLDGSYCLGAPVDAFERRFAELCGAQAAVGVNSGTSALHLALLACGVGPGDEVITTPWTFIATAWAISYCGATPVFADVDDETLCLDPGQVEPLVTERTKAVIPVHIYGQAADMDPLQAICERHGLALIEDAAQAHGATYRGRPVGTLGRAACFSFYPSKNLGACGEGGAIVTDDPALADRVRALRDHAQVTRGVHEEVGYNYRMEGFQGAVLNVKLPHLAAWNERRRAIARAYLEGLAGLPDLRLPVEVEGRRHVYHQFVVRHPRRDQVRDALAAEGIGTGLYYPRPVHRQPAYAHLGYEEGRLPVAERSSGQAFGLPMFPELTDDEVAYVVDALRRAVG